MRSRIKTSRCRHVMRLTQLAALGIVCVAVTGCYTQLAMVDRGSLEARQKFADTASHRVDTVTVPQREVCYWTHDLWGYPILRCERTYYSDDWMLYNNAPWWYRSDPYWFDYKRCPRYYRYDPSCQCCRYYADMQYDEYDRDYSGGSSNGGGGGGSPPPDLRNRGLTPSSSSGASAVPARGTATSGAEQSTTQSGGPASQTTAAKENEAVAPPNMRERGFSGTDQSSGAKTAPESPPLPKSDPGARPELSPPIKAVDEPVFVPEQSRADTMAAPMNPRTRLKRW